MTGRQEEWEVKTKKGKRKKLQTGKKNGNSKLRRKTMTVADKKNEKSKGRREKE